MWLPKIWWVKPNSYQIIYIYIYPSIFQKLSILLLIYPDYLVGNIPITLAEHVYRLEHHMEVSWNWGTPISSIDRLIFHYKPSILGTPNMFKRQISPAGNVPPNTTKHHQHLVLLFGLFGISLRLILTTRWAQMEWSWFHSRKRLHK